MSEPQLDTKYLYKTLTVKKLASYFKIPRGDLHADIDYSHDILLFPLLDDKFDFFEEIYVAHLDRVKLNLDTFFNPKKFAKTMILEHFLIGEAQVRDTSAYIFCIHIGAMILVMSRKKFTDIAGYMKVEADEEVYYITTLDNYLKCYYDLSELVDLD